MPDKNPYLWMFRRIPAMTLYFDAEGRIQDASDMWLARMGYGRNEITGRRAEDFATAEGARRIIEEYAPLLRRASRLDAVPIELQTRQGEAVDCVTSAVVEYGSGPDATYLHTVAVYTELAAQAQIERHYRDLYRATPAMLYTVDPDGRVVLCSDRWLSKMGYRREEVLGRFISEFMSPASQERLSGGRLRDIISTGELDNEPREMMTRDGQLIEVLISATAERDAQGKVRRMLVAMKDVTERNRAERSLREAFEENARLREQLEHERDYLREEVNVSMNFGQIVGESPVLRKMLARIEAVAETSANVILLGESGVGKELVARAIHAGSPRAGKPLVKVNCAAVPRELFESEFFGHVKGAFTGAVKDRIGRFQLADGGTIFLDEVGEIPPELQSKLLRVLQEKEFEPVGSDRTRSIDVRVIAATNRDLEEMVEAGTFRDDLYYRLTVFPVEVPPLRERGDDVVQLAAHFLELACKDFGYPALTLDRSQAQALRSYDWPGNVRELQSVIERAVILGKGKTLRLDLSLPEASPAQSQATSSRPEPARESAADQAPEAGFMTEADLRSFERDNLVAALEAADWRVSGPGGAAELLGLRPTTLADRIRRMGIDRPRGAARRTA
ncbi:MAG: sigma 54-interacting transcriptional regulator [Gammaproteobacteria bacterium]|nr:sigma 54-interacting transcriptional regulator [Gammaproteobacteria bacterium]